MPLKGESAVPKGRYEQYSPFTKKVPVPQAAGTLLSSGGIYRCECPFSFSFPSMLLTLTLAGK
jgi:hypothetical protein